MILLDATTRKLQLVLASAKATNDCPYITNYADLTTTAYTPGSNNGTTNGTTAVDSVAAPAASTQRQLKSLFVQNADLALVVLKVRYNDNGTTRDLYIAQLQPGDTLQYTDSEGFRTCDQMGQRRVVSQGIGPGRWVKTSWLTSGTSFTTGRLTNKIKLRMWGGGGAGCGTATAVGQSGGGGGGASGGYAEKVFSVSPNTAYTYAIGAGGAGVLGTTGGDGTDTTFTVGATTVTAQAGSGNSGDSNSATILASGVDSPAAIATNGDLNGSGGTPTAGITLTALLAISGSGGSTILGSGGNSRNTQGDGNAAIANTAGGGGGSCTLNNGGQQTGGNGAAGLIIVDEYT